MGTQLPFPKRGQSTPNFGPFLLWPNGWMHQDATWYGGRPRPRPHCHIVLDADPAPPKGAQPPIFGACLLCPNGCMHQDTTWYGGRPQPKRHCVRWDPAPPPLKGHNFRLIYIVAKWMKTPLGTEEDLGPGHIVLDGDPAPPRERGTAAPPLFRPMSIVATVAHLSYC